MSNDRHAVMTKGIHNGECIRIPDPVPCRLNALASNSRSVRQEACGKMPFVKRIRASAITLKRLTPPRNIPCPHE